ncbi:MBL fold metallo-hydrolase [Sphingobium sufflavum]|uniref:MBL fold metallo-hydrolase n=1 Tax=Sphingobium sufflavum TaxID=1129547 RepID=UPI001F2C2641|nr:MBL fold metallo-hydrolase [Sphingobium sufflavum]MCE7798000.1 MBL fold metallo-hydrolase [Sphingobium sufflavum]
MLRLTILGCGTSSGVPRIGNDWGACDPTDPRNRRTRASILIESTTTRILVDTGPDLREQLLNANVVQLDAVLWTHDHADHCHGIDDIRQVAQVNKSAILGYARRQTMDLLKSRFTYAFSGRAGYPPIIMGDVLPQEGLQVGDIHISAVDMPHGEIFSTGFRFATHGHTVGYATDFHDVTEEMLGFFAGVDIWVADALRDRPHPTHSHLALTLDAVARVNPGRALLTHMDQSMDYADLADRLPDGIAPAYDGLVVTLGDMERSHG